MNATRWRKSTRSGVNGNCVELALDWRKSSYSNPNGECVELAHAGLVRDSKNPNGTVLPVDLPALLAAAKAGLLDH